MRQLEKLSLWTSGAMFLVLIISWVFGWTEWMQLISVAASVLLAIGLGSVESLKSYRYTLWILVAIIAGLSYPSAFLKWGEFDLRNKWLILIVVQLVMFGMGTQMSLKDFSGIGKMGKGVLVGILCQFSIMPLLGFGLTRVFDFEPEIAAGVVLIGSCSSGLASNVMVYIARANLTLSVTLTAVATLIAPIMTPFLMKTLAGTYIEIKFLDMCFQIIKIVIVPIGAALLAEALKTFSEKFRKRIYALSGVAIIWLVAMNFGLWSVLTSGAEKPVVLIVEMSNFLCGAILFGTFYYLLVNQVPKISGWMPLFSMFGIVYFTLVTTAASRDNIIQIGMLLFVVAIVHNAMGYTLGYFFSRMLKLDKQSARTIALEVGLQNGGMASGLAGVMGKLATLGLASAIFSPWMNISGSVLANFWKRKDAQD